MGIIKRDGFKLTIISYLGVVLGYVNKVLLFPNILTPEQVGLSNTLISVAIIYAQFATLGIPATAVKFFPYFRDRARGHHGFFGWGALIIALSTILVTILFIFLKPLTVKYFYENSPLLIDYYYYLIPLGISTVYYFYFEAYLRSFLKTVVPSFVNEILLRVLVGASVVFYALDVVNFNGFVVIYTMANCSHFIFLIVYMIYLKQLVLFKKFSFRVKKLSSRMMTYGLFSILNNAGNNLVANIDILMIAMLMANGMYFTGIYTTVLFISAVIVIPYRAMSKITTTIVSDQWKNHDIKGMNSLYKNTTLVNTIIGGAIFLLLWINFDFILSFLPADYGLGKYVFMFLAIGRLFDMICGINGAIMATSPKYKYDLFFTIALLALTVVNNYLFIKTFNMGIKGAAIATMITLVLYNGLRLYFIYANYKLNPVQKNFLLTLLILGLALLINTLIPLAGNKYLDLTIRSAIVVGIYGGTILFLKLSPDTNQFIYTLLKRIKLVK